METHDFADLAFEIADVEKFSPYEPYVDNFCFLVAVVLEERHRRQENLQQQERLQHQATDLKSSLDDLEVAQHKLIESEKMTALGQMTASMAHEINTPLGAIRSSAAFIGELLESDFAGFLDFVRNLNNQDYRRYLQLTSRGPLSGRSSTRSDRLRKRELIARLRPSLGEEAEEIAEAILLLEPVGDEDQLVAWAIEGKTVLLRRAAWTTELKRSKSIVLEAVDQATGIVATLQQYSRSGNAQGMDLVDPATDLNALLLLFFAKREVDVERRFSPGLTFIGNRDQFHSVWVTLLNRVLRGGASLGRLILTTSSVGDLVEVSLTDDCQAAVEDFRLEFCRRIVDDQGGTFQWKQNGDWTVFSLRMPRA